MRNHSIGKIQVLASQTKADKRNYITHEFRAQLRPTFTITGFEGLDFLVAKGEATPATGSGHSKAVQPTLNRA
jgi:hypothetical protein